MQTAGVTADPCALSRKTSWLLRIVDDTQTPDVLYDWCAQAAFLGGLRSGKLLTEAARHFVQVLTLPALITLPSHCQKN